MKTLLENEYQEILLHEDLGVFEERFKEASSHIFGEDYIREVSFFGKAIVENQSKEQPFSKLIINTLAGGPTMEPQVQQFMHEEFYPMILKAGIRHKAYCLGPEIIAKLSVELTVDNDPRQQFNYQFFATLEESMAWLQTIRQ
ncbi:MAG: hypothetical protein ABJG47_17790 [Ekhidna sp.]